MTEQIRKDKKKTTKKNQTDKRPTDIYNKKKMKEKKMLWISSLSEDGSKQKYQT